MIADPIWLASYPRSGNTFLRILLKHCFGTSVSSKYDEDYTAFDDAFGALLGVGDTNRFNIVKTHDIECDRNRAIYVVRDGRASVVSYYHYCRDFETPRSLREIILGQTPFGSWSRHYRGWNPKHRNRTLVLRFEDLVHNTEQAVAAISRFLGVIPIDRPDISFAKLHSVAPNFFRSGSDRNNIVELSGEDLELFSSLHGELMAELGYPVDDSSDRLVPFAADGQRARVRLAS